MSRRWSQVEADRVARALAAALDIALARSDREALLAEVRRLNLMSSAQDRSREEAMARAGLTHERIPELIDLSREYLLVSGPRHRSFQNRPGEPRKLREFLVRSPWPDPPRLRGCPLLKSSVRTGCRAKIFSSVDSLEDVEVEMTDYEVGAGPNRFTIEAPVSDQDGFVYGEKFAAWMGWGLARFFKFTEDDGLPGLRPGRGPIKIHLVTFLAYWIEFGHTENWNVRIERPIPLRLPTRSLSESASRVQVNDWTRR